MLLLPALACRAERVFFDDLNREIHLQNPAQRIISLTPHVTELLFSAGAGGKIVGTVSHSDYPAEAKSITRIGDAAGVDVEKIIALEPDIIIVWASGTNHSILERLRRLDIPLYYTEAATLEQIAGSLVRLGRLAGTDSLARKNSDAFLRQLHSLQQAYSSRAPVTVFYQFWARPIFSVNKNHLINDVIRLCGGRNIFAGLPSLTPTVDIEAVLAGDPDVIIVSGRTDSPPPWLGQWRKWPEMNAVKSGQLYSIPPDFLLRNTLRTIKGAGMMCQYLDAARRLRRPR